MGDRSPASPWDNEEVLRGELFSIERLEQHAISLAAAQQIAPKPVRRPPLAVRLTDNETVLLAAYHAIARAVGEDRAITPAAEWLLDNYHLVQDQIREIREDLPPGFYRQLPKLASGPFMGYPRVFGIAWAFVAHTDSHFEPDALRRFVKAYQTVVPLSIGELWAVAITLRIVLVENMRRAAQRILSSREARQEADELADRLLAGNGDAVDPGILLRRYDDGRELHKAFVVQLVQRLRDQDPRITPALTWLEDRLSAGGLTAEAVVRDEHQRQAMSNVTVRNVITSMRLISELEWSDFFESVSLVDEALGASSDFARMDFATRNLYRSRIEELARGTKLSELDIAAAAITAARNAPDQAGRASDPGFHLIAAGRAAFESAVGYRAPLRHLPGRLLMRCGAGPYIGAILLMAPLILALPLLGLGEQGIAGPILLVLGLLGLLPAMDAAVALVNQAVTRSVPATALPGLALREGVPAELRTLVAVPILLTSAQAIAEEIERLEIHYLASPEDELHFALLSDWVDAAAEHADGDDELLAVATHGIARLNRLYGPVTAGDRFMLLHRRRVWSATQQKWMGWERKRGKLHELNRLLRGATSTTFVDAEGCSPAVPPGVRFVITLDADTRLPRDAARRLIGKLAHPLNRPRFDAATARVVEGHAVLQPRVTPSLPMGHEGSLFQRIVSSSPGLDPYAAAVSDVYQDLFGEGSYAGKGIYDVDAFEAALAGRTAEGALLSHDLFEGIFARAALVSDIEVIEEFPERYDVACARQHRWARGDWQLLPWLLGRRTRAGGDGQGNALPLLSAWKMTDNLRRTLSAPAAFAALVAGWLLPLPAALAWTAFVLATITVPALLPAVAAIVPRHSGITARSHLGALARDFRRAIGQVLFQIVALPHQAWLMTDAIVRTLYRLFVSHRNLLEWVTAEQAALAATDNTPAIYLKMLGSVAIALAGFLLVLFLPLWVGGSSAAWIAAPFTLLWLAAPALALGISRSRSTGGSLVVTPDEARDLRLVARRTWRFFETFVTAEDNMLPPDNFQEDPTPVLAHRTSPTNIGLYLLSTASARDFGWIGTVEALERIEATLATMDRLQRFRGHFYNWYDTRDLRPLDPRYVSTVDSGNLAAHLVTAANAACEWVTLAITPACFAAGARDALDLAREALDSIPGTLRRGSALWPQLGEQLDRVAKLLGETGPPGAENPARLHALARHTATLVDIARTLASEHTDEAHSDLLYWTDATQRSIESWRRDSGRTHDAAHALKARLIASANTMRRLAYSMDFAFLLDPQRRLLSIGYRTADGSLDPNCYDLLASEARLASFFAIAKGDVPSRHWFRLGRQATPVGAGAALVSWSGSMFEYLMPSLVMRAPAGSLLEQTSRLIVRRQVSYGAALGLPWGISESAYNVRDLELTYQYSNFGVPGLGLKRGLSSDAVVAPYATALASMVDPGRATRNFAALATQGAVGRYGYYEALDFTRSRLPEGARLAIVRAFMAHHQGMTVVAIANVLLDGTMRRRFHAEPRVQATELLLQERTPRDVSVAHPRAEEVRTAPRVEDLPLPEVRRLHTAHDTTPQAHLLSNGRYAVMVTAAGSGYSRWQDLGITRWRDDPTRDDTGSYLYIRDVDTGRVWSAGYQPTGVEPETYQVTFTEDRAEFQRMDARILTTLEIIVSPEEDAEVRQLSLTNTGSRERILEVTSCAELSLAPPAADAAHPAFSKLFVQTEYVARYGALLATRRKRAPGEPDVWAAHQAVIEGEVVGSTEIETDRARFLGRGHDVRAPGAMLDDRRLSNSVGTVLDPVFVLRNRVRVAPGATVRIAFWTTVASTRERVLDLVDRHHDANAFIRAGTLAWTQAQVQLRHLGITAVEASLFQRLAGRVLYPDAALRPASDSIRRGSGGPAGLWSQGISGDLPIVLLRINDMEDIPLARQLLQAHEYWRMKQLAVDLVILNERGASYIQELQIALDTLVRTSQSRVQAAPPVAANAARGSVFVLRADMLPADTQALLCSVARVVLVAQRGSLADQLDRARRPAVAPARVAPRPMDPADHPVTGPAPEDLEFFNGLGGFADDGREYVTLLGPGQATPAPWINVIANPSFGFQVAAEGSSFTWSMNSRENQLTPWSNDPVTDRPGEALYLRDEDSGEVWGPTVSPCHDPGAFHTARHGQGYSRFSHESRGVALDLLMYVPLEDPVRIARLKVRNLSGRPRRLSVTAYVEWVLGPSRAAGAPFIVTEMDPVTGAMFARNPWNVACGSRVAFADLAGRQTDWTADRRDFLGRHGTLAEPTALLRAGRLSRRVGAGLDPCGALQTTFTLDAGQSIEIVSLLGEAADAGQAQALLGRYRSTDLDAVFRDVVAHWDQLLGTVQVKTPDRSLDIILNRWMLYQTLACRVWARSGFYQASGAYGFRDQLQDGMALAIASPALTRDHLLRAAGRQFGAGDVQHWWLPTTGQGVRTRISDDRVWLAHAVAHYVRTTGDTNLLDALAPFLEGQALRPGEHDAFFKPSVSDEEASLFEHCARALDQSLAVGEHGLPLIGTGDWNDGMNRVGELGHGESIWLGWFLHATLTEFAPLAQARGDPLHAARWKAHAAALQAALEEHGWDGGWYRRGYFDDGTPLGSASSEECRIDSIAQSWSVISGAGSRERATQAMAAVDSQLIQPDRGLALLFAPPFDRTPLDPGYIKGYPPGIRENGGQYTHAAAWSVIAFAMLGQGDRAAALLSMLNPVNRTMTRAAVHRYKVEPYVVAADVYSVPPHAGRGGWTWYTGSAGWLYRAGLEWLLGFRLRGETLELSPCIPADWPGFEILFRYQQTRYEILVTNPDGVSGGVASAELDGRELPAGQTRIALVNDGSTHRLRLVLGEQQLPIGRTLGEQL
ncbi:MAG: glucoamylase family protein [Gammaproteobacteria bacterium]